MHFHNSVNQLLSLKLVLEWNMNFHGVAAKYGQDNIIDNSKNPNKIEKTKKNKKVFIKNLNAKKINKNSVNEMESNMELENWEVC